MSQTYRETYDGGLIHGRICGGPSSRSTYFASTPKQGFLQPPVIRTIISAKNSTGLSPHHKVPDVSFCCPPRVIDFRSAFSFAPPSFPTRLSFPTTATSIPRSHPMMEDVEAISFRGRHVIGGVVREGPWLSAEAGTLKLWNG
jgi:hypothetical protein